MDVTERIRALRKERGYTQVELAKEISITSRSLQDLEAGRCLPSHETFLALADHFGVSLDYLAGRTEVRETARVFGAERSEMP